MVYICMYCLGYYRLNWTISNQALSQYFQFRGSSRSSVSKQNMEYKYGARLSALSALILKNDLQDDNDTDPASLSYFIVFLFLLSFVSHPYSKPFHERSIPTFLSLIRYFHVWHCPCLKLRILLICRLVTYTFPWPHKYLFGSWQVLSC